MSGLPADPIAVRWTAAKHGARTVQRFAACMPWSSLESLRPAGNPGRLPSPIHETDMFTHDPFQAECLSLIASLYGAVTDHDQFLSRRAECEDWLSRQPDPATPAARFLRLQVKRATEARNLAAAGRSNLPTACAVLTIDDRGRPLAASPETWTLVGSGSPSDDPLRLPLALRAFVEDAGLSPSVPRALRVPLDDGSSELAGIVLGVDQVSHAAGTMRVMTLLLCDVGTTAAPERSNARAEVREFRRVARDRESSRPFAVSLAADRSA